MVRTKNQSKGGIPPKSGFPSLIFDARLVWGFDDRILHRGWMCRNQPDPLVENRSSPQVCAIGYLELVSAKSDTGDLVFMLFIPKMSFPLLWDRFVCCMG